MNKRLSKALLFGTLLLASTSVFVSCKDYDDDIQNLQTQINNLDQVVGTKEATINTSITSLQASLNALENAYKSGDAATLAAAQAAVNEAKTALEASIKKNYDNLVAKDAELSAAIVKAQASADQAITLLGDKADKTELAKVNTELQNTIKELNTLSSTVTEAQQNIQKLQTALNAQEAALKTTNDNVAEAQANIAQLKKDLAAQEASLKAAIADEATRVDNELSKINGTIDELKAAHNLLASKEEVNEVKRNVAKVEGDVSELSTKLGELDVMQAMLAKDLRSLVYMPHLYMDGIETIEYPYLKFATLDSIQKVITRKEADETYVKTIRNVYDFYDKVKTDSVVFGPAWPVEYHENPSNTQAVYSDVKGWYAYKVETITRATPSNTASALKISSPEKYENDDPLFNNSSDGIMTAGLKINWSQPSEVFANDKDGQNNVIVALQVKSHLDGTRDTTITSDYAMIFPEKVRPEGIIWYSKPAYWTTTSVNYKRYHDVKGYDATATGDLQLPAYWKWTERDTICPMTTKTIHLWTDPMQALKKPADIELYYDDRTGVKLSQYLGLHYVRESDPMTAACKNKQPGTWKFDDKELQRFGLLWQFDLVDYTVDGLASHDSRYASINPLDGTIIAQNVKEDGVTYANESATAVDREPLVRVRLYHKRDGVKKPILDGYIRVHITEKPVEEKEQDLDIKEYAENGSFPHTFDLCNGTGAQTTWAQFSKWVLTDNMENMEKETFDAQYVPDLQVQANWQVTPDRTLADGGRLYKMNMFNENHSSASNYGTIYYIENESGTTNHGFRWELDEYDLEALTHDNDLAFTDGVELTRLVRYTAIPGTKAKYRYIYVYLKWVLKRQDIETATIKEPIVNYWKTFSGEDNGQDAIALNCPQPIDLLSTNPWRNDVNATYKGNRVTYSGVTGTNYKYYFVPKYIEINAQNGKNYLVTPRRGKQDSIYSHFVCKYHKDGDIYSGIAEMNPTNFHHKLTKHLYNVIDENANNDILKKCAIAYDGGVFQNDTLFAVEKGALNTAEEYTAIAILNKTTGEITLLHDIVENQFWPTIFAGVGSENKVTFDLVNAVGYNKTLKRNPLDKQLREFLGVIVPTRCQLAAKMSNWNKTFATFQATWERPINVDADGKLAEDAKNNGNYIYALDFLHMYDWRGPEKGYMDQDQYWLWAYYNVKSIELDLRPSVVKTNMHQANSSTFVALNTISTKVTLTGGFFNGTTWVTNALTTATFNLAAYNAADQNDALVQNFMKLENDADANGKHDGKGRFGYIYYANNGENVEDFDIIVPVTIGYEWGYFQTEVTIHIDRTMGN